MAKIGSIRVCKARVSTTHKKKCGNRYTVNHRMQKFCSDKCRNRNNRITKSDRLKKEQKISSAAAKKLEYIKTFRGQIDLMLIGIKSMYDKMYDCMNQVKPVLKKKDKYSSEKRELYEVLKNEFEMKKGQVPIFKDMLQREVSSLGVLLASKWKELEGDGKKEIEGIIKRTQTIISSDYYKDAPNLKSVLKSSLKEHGYDIMPDFFGSNFNLQFPEGFGKLKK